MRISLYSDIFVDLYSVGQRLLRFSITFQNTTDRTYRKPVLASRRFSQPVLSPWFLEQSHYCLSGDLAGGVVHLTPGYFMRERPPVACALRAVRYASAARRQFRRAAV